MALFGNTLAQVRQYLSAEMGDLILSTAGGTPTSATYVDTMLRKGNDYYNNHGYKGYCFEGEAVGQEREVSDWTLTEPSNTITFAPALSPAPIVGDKFELHYIFTEDDYRKAINLAIEALAGKYLIDIRDVTAITLVANTYEYALPLSLLYLERVITEKTATSGVFEAEDEVDPRDWSILKAYPPKLKLHEDRYSITAGKDLRLEGQGTQPLVDDDTDVIYLPTDWLVQKAITCLPKNKIQSNELDATYQQALILSAKKPKNWPNPYAKAIVE